MRGDEILWQASSPGIFEYEIKAEYQHYLLKHDSKPRFRSSRSLRQERYDSAL
jgi:hypothetical protein